MNPDTRKFEQLKSVFEKNVKSEIEKKMKELNDEFDVSSFVKTQDSVLCRPDGTPVPKHWTIFKTGENVTVKDWTFKVVYINESILILEPVNQIIGENNET